MAECDVNAPKYHWERKGLKRTLIDCDKEDVSYKDFRKQESQKIVDVIKSGSRLVLVRANSGFGISKFLLPTLKQMFSDNDLSLTHASQLDRSYVDLASELGNVIVVDELSESSGGDLGGLTLLREIINIRPDLQVILILDDEADPERKQSLAMLSNQNTIPVIEIQPKLLNINQAIEYAIGGAPFRQTGQEHTFFSQLTPQETEQIIIDIASRFPLNFRVIDQLRNIDPYDTHDNLLSFEERLQLVKNKSIDNQIIKFLSIDKIGITK